MLDLQQTVYKLMLTDILNNRVSKLLGAGKTVIILGGISYPDAPNTDWWILQDDEGSGIFAK